VNGLHHPGESLSVDGGSAKIEVRAWSKTAGKCGELISIQVSEAVLEAFDLPSRATMAGRSAGGGGHTVWRRAAREWAGRVRMGPVGFLESRRPTAGPAKATSTHVLLSLLRVLFRQRAVVRSRARM
jgi:hypothetical protein